MIERQSLRPEPNVKSRLVPSVNMVAVLTIALSIPLPLYSGGEGRGEGVFCPSRSFHVFARFIPLPPNPSPPEYRWRGETSEPSGKQTAFLGAGSCAAAACHGRPITSGIQGSEYTLW